MMNPDFSPPIDRLHDGGFLLPNLLLFGRLCRRLGLAVNPETMIDASRALGWIELARKQDFYHTLKSLMVNRVEEMELFDQAFELFWKKSPDGFSTLDLRSLGEKQQRRPQIQYASAAQEANRGAASSQEQPVLLATYSPQELLRHKDFAEMSGEELSMARNAIEQMGALLSFRRSRRRVAGRGRQVDLRRLTRVNLRHWGEWIQIPSSYRKQKPRPLVLICDVSGSMERYTRILLHFVHTLSELAREVESFVFSTQLTRITRMVKRRSVDEALTEVGWSVKDWSGGTLTGQALKEFNYRWSRRVLGRGAVTLLITDGWDRGDIELLSREASRLQRSCHRLIWLNPLLGSPQYQPLTLGAQALLPQVDDFLSVRNLHSLEVLAQTLKQLQRP